MILIDSNILIAYFNKRDKNHNSVVKIFKKFDKKNSDELIISDYIFNEIVTVTLLKKKDKITAIKAGNEVLKSRIRIIKVGNMLFSKAWNLFKRSKLKMSFTDFTNLAIMDLLKIQDIATFDKDFKKIKGIHIIGE